LNSGSFSDFASEIVKLGSANLTVSKDFELGYVRRVERESSLDSDAAGDLADRNGLGNAAMLKGNDDAFEKLNALLASFSNLHVCAYCVAGSDSGNVRFLALGNNTF
jgi:hypothetical protein